VEHNKVYQLLGLAEKAHAIASGEFMTENKIKAGKAALVIIAEDASDNTKKMFRNMCDFHHVLMYEYGTKEELGHAIGKEMRASLALTNEGFKNTIVKHLDESGKKHYHNTEEIEWLK